MSPAAIGYQSGYTDPPPAKYLIRGRDGKLVGTFGSRAGWGIRRARRDVLICRPPALTTEFIPARRRRAGYFPCGSEALSVSTT
jgi:hypothetical protein